MSGRKNKIQHETDFVRNGPTAVILTIEEDDGRRAEMELVYSTRFAAEWFVYQLPYLMSVGQWSQVRSAIISPLVCAG